MVAYTSDYERRLLAKSLLGLERIVGRLVMIIRIRMIHLIHLYLKV